MPRKGSKHYVMSNVLGNLERQCQQYMPLEPAPLQKVAVIGAGSDVGRIVCLFLKMQSIIKVLAMYDDIPDRKVIGQANDLAHIDTSTAVEAYQGRPHLKDALDNADVVLICGGHYDGPPCYCIPDHQIFSCNQSFVRTVSLACAFFCPKAVICIQVPPVDCNFNLCRYTMGQHKAYNPRRVLGVNAINSMRANQLYCALADIDPHKNYTPVVCGTCRCTRVPVFSNNPQYMCVDGEQIDFITRLVREADELIGRVKSNNQRGHLSIGFSTARFVTQVMQGLFCESAFIDSALVEQDDPEKAYGLEVCATPIRVGPHGISEYCIPQLNDQERELLESSKCDLEDLLDLGRCYAVGDEYRPAPCKYFFPAPPLPPCPECQPAKASSLG
ncbi:lactate/malate dehydrogenase, NAD binding domain-containing protein [Phthorimaea operculella]|nr:lactate/malate dehydrogenase, NAD binding domain-containing protein [Phthorimaea operculella]